MDRVPLHVHLGFVIFPGAVPDEHAVGHSP